MSPLVKPAAQARQSTILANPSTSYHVYHASLVIQELERPSDRLSLVPAPMSPHPKVVQVQFKILQGAVRSLDRLAQAGDQMYFWWYLSHPGRQFLLGAGQPRLVSLSLVG